jgi:cell shape-determining protein MreC
MKKFSSITRVNSHHISRDKKIKRILLLSVLALLLVFIVPKITSWTASLIMTPVHRIEAWMYQSTDSFPYFFRDRSVLIGELNDLKYTQSAQSGDRLTSQLLSAENESLRALLGATEERRLVAGVIGRPHKMPYDVLVLDKGSDDGIFEGAPVFIGDDAVIGVVGKTFARSSVVTLVTTPGFSTSVYIIGPDIYTTAEGIGGGQLKIGVPQGIKMEEGNLVILPGIDAGIYGRVSIVRSVASEPEQYGYVAPEVPLSGLRLVAVGTVPLKSVTFEEAQKIVFDTKKSLFEVPVPEGVLVTTVSSTTASSTLTATSTPTSSTIVP